MCVCVFVVGKADISTFSKIVSIFPISFKRFSLCILILTYFMLLFLFLFFSPVTSWPMPSRTSEPFSVEE